MYYNRYFTCIIIPIFPSQGSWGTERLSNLPKATGISRSRLQTQKLCHTAVWILTQHSVSAEYLVFSWNLPFFVREFECCFICLLPWHFFWEVACPCRLWSFSRSAVFLSNYKRSLLMMALDSVTFYQVFFSKSVPYIFTLFYDQVLLYGLRYKEVFSYPKITSMLSYIFFYYFFFSKFWSLTHMEFMWLVV